MNECAIPKTGSPIMQGDIFLRQDWERKTSWDRLGIIITADCDIAQKKTPGFLSFVPVISLDDYGRDVWATKRLEKEYKEKTTARLQKMVLDLAQRQNPDALPMTEVALVKWTLRMSNPTIIEDLCARDQKAAAELSDLLDAVRLFHKDQDLADFSKLAVLRALNDHDRSKPLSERRSKHAKTVRKEFRNYLSNLPQDVFFLADIPDLPRDYPHKLGFLAMLAHIRALPLVEITDSLSSARELPSAAMRIAKLNDHYKFALSQGFSHLFARIGMPQEYEEGRDLVLDDFCENLKIGD